MDKRKAYLTHSIWSLVMMWVAWVIGVVAIDLLFADNADLQRILPYVYQNSLLLGMFWLLFRWFMVGFRAEQKIKKRMILCIYCGYVLEVDQWPQCCPECGETQTRDEVIKYWEPHADLDWFMDLEKDSS